MENILKSNIIDNFINYENILNFLSGALNPYQVVDVHNKIVNDRWEDYETKYNLIGYDYKSFIDDCHLSKSRIVECCLSNKFNISDEFFTIYNDETLISFNLSYTHNIIFEDLAKFFTNNPEKLFEFFE